MAAPAWTAILLLLLPLTGCLGPESPITDQADVASAQEPPFVVVGTIDRGINPYHDLFQDRDARLPPSIIDATTGEPPVTVRLTQTGSFQERVDADAETWASLEPGVLYWFEGTRILGISLDPDSPDPPLLDGGGHGTSVSSVIRTISPEAWLVMVEIPGLFSVQRGLTPQVFGVAADGIRWLADQPWLDVIASSTGFDGNAPLPVWDDYVVATELATSRGKVITSAAGNDPLPSLATGTAGPPWLIAVGGAEGSTRGESARASRLVDLVADFTRYVANTEPDAYTWVHGTSFASPGAGGNVAQALLELRRASDSMGRPDDGVLCTCDGRDITSADLRHALNLSAVYWNTTDWDPLNYTAEYPYDHVFFATAPILPTPWLQMGWGYVGDHTWQTMVTILRGEPAPDKPLPAQDHMATYQAAREAYWASKP